MGGVQGWGSSGSLGFHAEVFSLACGSHHPGYCKNKLKQMEKKNGWLFYAFP